MIRGSLLRVQRSNVWGRFDITDNDQRSRAVRGPAAVRQLADRIWLTSGLSHGRVAVVQWGQCTIREQSCATWSSRWSMAVMTSPRSRCYADSRSCMGLSRRIPPPVGGSMTWPATTSRSAVSTSLVEPRGRRPGPPMRHRPAVTDPSAGPLSIALH